MKQTIRILGTAVVALAMAACSGGGGGKKAGTGSPAASGQSINSSRTAVVACDASFENVMQEEVGVFEFINPKMTILPMYIDESACVDSLLKGRAMAAVTSRELRQSETDILKRAGRTPSTTRIAVDAIALIVNKDNPVNELTVGELADILDGKYKTWRDLQPSTLGDISVVFDHQGSSTVRYMRDSVMTGRDFGCKVFAQGDNKAVFEAVKKNKNAIGVIGVSWIASDMSGAEITAEQRAQNLDNEDVTDVRFSNDIKVLRVRRDNELDSYQPYQAYILDGSYPLFRSIYMISTGFPGTAAHSFYVFVTGWRGQKVILSTGVLPSTVRPRVVSLQ